jgi:predicted transcriptional regulator
MSHAITLTLPDLLFEPVQRIARATNQPVEAVLVKALQVSLPSLDGLSGDVLEALDGLEDMDNTVLERVMREHVGTDAQDELAGTF